MSWAMAFPSLGFQVIEQEYLENINIAQIFTNVIENWGIKFFNSLISPGLQDENKLCLYYWSVFGQNNYTLSKILATRSQDWILSSCFNEHFLTVWHIVMNLSRTPPRALVTWGKWIIVNIANIKMHLYVCVAMSVIQTLQRVCPWISFSLLVFAWWCN